VEHEEGGLSEELLHACIFFLLTSLKPGPLRGQLAFGRVFLEVMFSNIIFLNFWRSKIVACDSLFLIWFCVCVLFVDVHERCLPLLSPVADAVERILSSRVIRHCIDNPTRIIQTKLTPPPYRNAPASFSSAQNRFN